MAHLIAYVVFKHYLLSSQKSGYCYFVLCQEYLEWCLAVTSPAHHHKHIVIYPSLQCPWAGTEMKWMLNLLKRLPKFLSYIHTPHSVYGCWFWSTLILCITKQLCILLIPNEINVLERCSIHPRKKAPPECLDFFPHMGLTAHTSSRVHILWA